MDRAECLTNCLMRITELCNVQDVTKDVLWITTKYIVLIVDDTQKQNLLAVI